MRKILQANHTADETQAIHRRTSQKGNAHNFDVTYGRDKHNS